MIEYVLGNNIGSGFAYNSKRKIIKIKLLPNIPFTDDEIIRFTSDSLTHEFIHYLLDREFDLTICNLFDWIGNSFKQHLILHQKYYKFCKLLYPERNIRSYRTLSFEQFLYYYEISSDNLENAKEIVNKRKIKNDGEKKK